MLPEKFYFQISSKIDKHPHRGDQEARLDKVVRYHMIEGVMANFIETINHSVMGKKGDQKESNGNAYFFFIFTDIKEGVKNTQKGL